MKLPCIEGLCFYIILGICNAQMDSTKPTYCRAAVHEMKQYNDITSPEMEIINKNLEKYNAAASLAAWNNVDIIVFPEKGLFPMKIPDMAWFLKYAEDIPHSSEMANPCNDNKFSNSPILRNFSCIAQKNNFFVVATLIDVKKCKVRRNCENRMNKNSCVANRSDCPISGYFKFNTLVVFNRGGTLVARYYKRHPFIPLEIGITTPKYPEPAYFSDGSCSYATDIGLDSLFNNSVIDIEKRPETSAVAHADWWFDHTPLHYFSIPVQQAWSLTNNVTVLSSEVHAPNLGSLGSGIYIPDQGAVIHSYNPDGKSKLLISNIPASNSNVSFNDKSLDKKFFYIEDDNTVTELNGEEPRDFKEECGENVLGPDPIVLTDYRCKHTDVSKYTFIKLNKTEDYINICSNGFCCSLEYQAESMDETFYFAVSGYRLKFYDIWYFAIQSCFLARCEPVAGQPCRNFLLKSNTKFLNVKITGSFDTDHIYPHILESELRLPKRNEWTFDGMSQLKYKNLRMKNNTYFNLYGRMYPRDGLVNNPISNTLPKLS